MSEDRLAIQSWMCSKETQAVIQALLQGGAGARFVGGCVRDALMGRPITDIDIATDAPPDRVMELLRGAGYKVVPTGIAHGTVTAVVGGKSFEITTLRKDVETDGRHATVAFTDDWTGDAARRDFTINTLSLEPGGVLHDPFNGRSDLAAGRIRFVGDPHTRIEEDVLRLLRFFRFFAYFGKMPPDATALAACRDMAPRLMTLSGERIRTELLKLLAAPDPAPAVALMRENGILHQVLPEADNVDRLRRLIRIETLAEEIQVDPLRRLAALLTTDGDGMEALSTRLRLSRAESDYLRLTVDESVSEDWDGRRCRRALYRLGASAFQELVLLGWANGVREESWPILLDAAKRWEPKLFPLSGEDALQTGAPPGPAVGELLRAVEEWWIESDFTADRAACLARLTLELSENG